jgi:ribosome-binding protein aMBF1 (putative translation factor)
MDEFVELPNVSTIEKSVRRCEECDRETDEYVMYVNPDNSEHIVCWTCQQRGDKHFNTKESYRLERSGGRYLPKSPKFD